MSSAQILVHIEKPVNYTLFEVKWIPFSSQIVTLGSHPRGTGVMQIYEMSKGQLNLLKEVERPKAIKCGTLSASQLPQRHLATGDFDGALTVWNLERPDVPVFSANAHSSIINAIDGCGGVKVGIGAPEIVTCGRDGLVKVWDIRQKAPVAIMEPEEGHAKKDCWTVSFGNAYNETERMIAAGFENGDLKIFDLKTMKVFWETNVGNGVCCTEFDRKDIEMNKLTVCTLDSKIFVFDMRNKHPTKGFAFARQKAHKSTVWAGKHSPHDRDILMTCGGNGSVCLWKYEYPVHRTTKDSEGNVEGVPGKLNLVQEIGVAAQPITAFDWNPQFSGLSVCSSFDQTIRVLGVTNLNCI